MSARTAGQIDPRSPHNPATPFPKPCVAGSIPAGGTKRLSASLFDGCSLSVQSRRVGESEPKDAEELFQENQNLREQRQAIGDVLRAVVPKDFQPVLDEIVEAAKLLCHGEHAQLYSQPSLDET
jgi:hypothetical protein